MLYPKTDFCPFNDDEPYSTPEDCGLSKNSPVEPMEPPVGNSKQEMMRQIQEICFAITDLNLFLDTHPNCTQAIELYTKLCATAKSLKSDYQARYGPLYATESANKAPFSWVEDDRKWPWEF